MPKNLPDHCLHPPAQVEDTMEPFQVQMTLLPPDWSFSSSHFNLFGLSEGWNLILDRVRGWQRYRVKCDTNGLQENCVSICTQFLSESLKTPFTCSSWQAHDDVRICDKCDPEIYKRFLQKIYNASSTWVSVGRARLISVVANELVEFEKNAVKAQNFKKTTDHFSGT